MSRSERIFERIAKKAKFQRSKTLSQRLAEILPGEHVDYRVSNLKFLQKSRFGDPFSKRVGLLNKKSELDSFGKD